MAASITVKVSIRTNEAIAHVEQIAWTAALQTASAIEQDIKGAGPHAQDAAAYPNAAGGWTYIPSAPGTPPRPRTGNLRRSYNIDPHPQERMVRVGSDPAIAPYAPFVELGTRFMEARPALIPALEYQAKFFAQRIANGLAAL